MNRSRAWMLATVFALATAVIGCCTSGAWAASYRTLQMPAIELYKAVLELRLETLRLEMREIRQRLMEIEQDQEEGRFV